MFLFAVLYFSERVSFFSMCQGMTRSACAFDAQDLCNTMGVISMCIRFFPFFLNSYDPNIGRTMTSFSNEFLFLILKPVQPLFNVNWIWAVCYIWTSHPFHPPCFINETFTSFPSYISIPPFFIIPIAPPFSFT